MQVGDQVVITVSTSGYTASRVTHTGVAADLTPDPFSFSDLTSQPLGTLVISNMITVWGFNCPVSISVTGGEYRIGTGPWTNTNGTITNGQQVTLRQTSSASHGSTTSTVLTVGGTSDTWSVTTIPVAGDINDDGLVNLEDAIMAIQIVAGITPSQSVHHCADVNGDRRIGLAEAIYILQKVTGER